MIVNVMVEPVCGELNIGNGRQVASGFDFVLSNPE